MAATSARAADLLPGSQPGVRRQDRPGVERAAFGSRLRHPVPRPPVLPRPLPGPLGRRQGHYRVLDPGRGPRRAQRHHHRPDRIRRRIPLTPLGRDPAHAVGSFWAAGLDRVLRDGTEVGLLALARFRHASTPGVSEESARPFGAVGHDLPNLACSDSVAVGVSVAARRKRQQRGPSCSAAEWCGACCSALS